MGRRVSLDGRKGVAAPDGGHGSGPNTGPGASHAASFLGRAMVLQVSDMSDRQSITQGSDLSDTDQQSISGGSSSGSAATGSESS